MLLGGFSRDESRLKRGNAYLYIFKREALVSVGVFYDEPSL